MIHFFPVMKMLKIPDFPMPQNRLKTRIREKLLDAFDVNYAVSEIRIETTEDFEKALYMPFAKGKKSITAGNGFRHRRAGLCRLFCAKANCLRRKTPGRFLKSTVKAYWIFIARNRRFKPSTKRFTAKRKKKTCIPCLRLPSTIWI